MFHIKIFLKPSQIHGIGLFAGEDIKKNEIVYTINESLDLILSEKDFSALSEDEKKTVKHYGYFDKNRNAWHLAFDDIRFCNHDKEGNLTFSGDNLVAKRDILEGEELTQNYEEFEELREELR